MYSESQHPVPQIKPEQNTVNRAEVASGYVNRMIERESAGWGDVFPAIRRLSTRYKLSYWTLDHLRKRKAKQVNDTTFTRIRTAYLDLCERQINSLIHELELEKARNPDAHMEDFEREATQLREKVRAAKNKTAG